MMMAGGLSAVRSATAAVGATARPATALPAVVVVTIIIGDLAAEVAADRLENHVEIALDTKSGTQRCDVQLMRTEVMKYGRPAIQQRLDIDQIPRPVPVAENALAE